MSCEVVNISTENELSSTSVPSGAIAHMHNNMQNSMLDTDVPIMESDMPYRPDSTTCVAHAERSVGDVDTCAKGSSNHSGHVEDENVTCQYSCAKGSSNHADYWKRVISFGTASADLIIPVDDELVKKRIRVRDAHTSSAHIGAKQTTNTGIQNLFLLIISYITNQMVGLQILSCLIMMSFRD